MEIYMHRMVLENGKTQNKDLEMTIEDLNKEIKNGWTTDLDIASKSGGNMVVRFLNGMKNDCRKDNLQRIYIKK